MVTGKRPVRITLKDKEDKDAFFEKLVELKAKGVYISNDLNELQRNDRKTLREIQKFLNTQNVKSKIKGNDKLIINGNTYNVYETMEFMEEEEESTDEESDIALLTNTPSTSRKRARKNDVNFKQNKIRKGNNSLQKYKLNGIPNTKLQRGIKAFLAKSTDNDSEDILNKE